MYAWRHPHLQYGAGFRGCGGRMKAFTRRHAGHTPGRTVFATLGFLDRDSQPAAPGLPCSPLLPGKSTVDEMIQAGNEGLTGTFSFVLPYGQTQIVRPDCQTAVIPNPSQNPPSSRRPLRFPECLPLGSGDPQKGAHPSLIEGPSMLEKVGTSAGSFGAGVRACGHVLSRRYQAESTGGGDMNLTVQWRLL